MYVVNTSAVHVFYLCRTRIICNTYGLYNLVHDMSFRGVSNHLGYKIWYSTSINHQKRLKVMQILHKKIATKNFTKILD